MLKNQSFGNAIQALNSGKMISREGWNGQGLFVFKQVPSVVPADFIYKMSSLPPSVKETLIRRGNPITYNNQLCLVTPDSKVYGWTPSPSDSLAEDWVIHEFESNPPEDAFDADTVGIGTPI